MKQWSYVFLLYIFTVDSASVDSKHGHDRVVSDRKLSHKEHFHGEDHDFDYDHEAFLGADEAREFDQLPPEESRARLGKIVDKIGNVQVFVNLSFILYARWRFKIVCLQTKLASLAIRKK